jgi:type IV pilus assembly protein PilA
MKKGFTLIELLAVIVILAIIALIATPLILNVIDEAKKGSFKNSAYGIVQTAELKYTQDTLSGNEGEATFTYVDGVETSNVDGKKLDYKGSKPQNGVVKINNNGEVALALHDGKYCALKSYSQSSVTVIEVPKDECNLVEEIAYSDFNVLKGVNKPKLATGMTPIKWNETEWVDTTESDLEWYDYSTKKWANAKTEDGSFWVWIPRYAYQIADGYHTSETGTINIKFLIDKTNNTIDAVPIATTPLYSGDSQTNYVSHPAFKFGDNNVTGIWVAKFEPTAVEGLDNATVGDNVTTKTVKIIPNVQSWQYITAGNAYEVVMNMKEKTDVYGWNASEIDTHMMKNTEWGAVAYLSKSIYGMNEQEIWINPNSDYITGCAGNSAAEAGSTICNEYHTVNGVKTSTTGSVYGVYDMVGGASERMFANYENNEAMSGIDPSTVLDKYIDRYGGDNRGYNDSVYGDAVYETSLGATYNGSSWEGNTTGGWYGDTSRMPFSTGAWFFRGGRYSSGTSAGVFAYYISDGGSISGNTFRPVLLVGEGL